MIEFECFFTFGAAFRTTTGNEPSARAARTTPRRTRSRASELHLLKPSNSPQNNLKRCYVFAAWQPQPKHSEAVFSTKYKSVDVIDCVIKHRHHSVQVKQRKAGLIHQTFTMFCTLQCDVTRRVWRGRADDVLGSECGRLEHHPDVGMVAQTPRDVRGVHTGRTGVVRRTSTRNRLPQTTPHQTRQARRWKGELRKIMTFDAINIALESTI